MGSEILVAVLIAYVASLAIPYIASPRSLSKLMIISAVLIPAIYFLVPLLGGPRWLGLAIFGAIIALIFNFILYALSPKLIHREWASYAYIEHNQDLQEIVDRVAEKLGYRKKIQAVLIRSPDENYHIIPNAFAYGLFSKRIAVTDGLLSIMDREELEAVIGHEIGHHKHRDNSVFMILGALPSLLFTLSRSYQASAYAMDIEARSAQSVEQAQYAGFAALVAFIMSLILKILAFLFIIPVHAFNRLREHYADLEGAKATSKQAMQSALAKLKLYYSQSPEALKAIKSMRLKAIYIYAFTSPLLSKEEIESIMSQRAGIGEKIYELINTHPIETRRMRFLEKMSDT